MTEKMNNARDLFFNSGKTQREIADIVGVSERTIYNWVQAQNWQQIREASYHMPVMMADNICRQIVELQEAIQLREPGNRFPTAQEAEVQRKLINSLEKLKKYPTLGMYRQMFTNYFDSVRHRSDEFNWELRFSMDQFFEGEIKHGFAPHESEHYATHPNAPLETTKEKKRSKKEEESLADKPVDAHGATFEELLNEGKPKMDFPAVVKNPLLKEPTSHENVPEIIPGNIPSYLEQIIERQRNNSFSTSVPPPAETGNDSSRSSRTTPPNSKPGKLIKRY